MVKCVTRGRYLVGLCLELRSIGGLCPTISVCASSSAPSVAYAPPGRSVLGAPLHRWLMPHQLGLCLGLRETSLDCAVRVVSPMVAGAFGPSCHLTLFITVLLRHQLIQEQDRLAERSKAVAQGAIPQGRGLEPHSCHLPK